MQEAGFINLVKYGPIFFFQKSVLNRNKFHTLHSFQCCLPDLLSSPFSCELWPGSSVSVSPARNNHVGFQSILSDLDSCRVLVHKQVESKTQGFCLETNVHDQPRLLRTTQKF